MDQRPPSPEIRIAAASSSQTNLDNFDSAFSGLVQVMDMSKQLAQQAHDQTDRLSDLLGEISLYKNQNAELANRVLALEANKIEAPKSCPWDGGAISTLISTETISFSTDIQDLKKRLSELEVKIQAIKPCPWDKTSIEGLITAKTASFAKNESVTSLSTIITKHNGYFLEKIAELSKEIYDIIDGHTPTSKISELKTQVHALTKQSSKISELETQVLTLTNQSTFFKTVAAVTGITSIMSLILAISLWLKISRITS